MKRVDKYNFLRLFIKIILKNRAFKAGFIGGSLFYSVVTNASLVPPIIGPWGYSVIRCETPLGSFSDENAAALAGLAANYPWPGWTLEQNSNDVWGTREHPQYGACGSDNSYPIYPYNYTMGYENYNVRNQTVINCDTNGNCSRDGMKIYRGRTIYCPAGTVQYGNLCSEQYTAILTQLSPLPKICAGNPIDVSTGAKIQSEQENFGVADLPFLINYSNSSPQSPPTWFTSFQQDIQPVDLGNTKYINKKSGSYNTEAEACADGWNNIKGQLSAPWVQTATASLNCGVCEVKNGTERMTTLAIVLGGESGSGVGSQTQEAVRVRRGNGSESTYVHIQSCNKDEWRLINGDSNQLLQTDPIGNFRLINNAGEVESYSGVGKLQAVSTSSGFTHTLSYDPTTGNLIKVASTSGHQLDLGYYGNNQLRSITVDNTKTTSFTYDANGLIKTVVRPDATSRQYHYEDTRFPKFLTGITDERNVRYATWKYDAQGRAISSEHAGGAEKTTLAFNADGTTAVTNPLGKKTTYLFDDILGVKRVKKVTGEPTASCVGANQNYTYTPEGFIDTQTDWKGNITKFGYDSFGRQILRTQAFGTTDATTTETCWHPTLNQPSRLVEPGKITLYDYWLNGQFKSQTIKPRPAGVVDCATAL